MQVVFGPGNLPEQALISRGCDCWWEKAKDMFTVMHCYKHTTEDNTRLLIWDQRLPGDWITPCSSLLCSGGKETSLG